MKICLVTPAPPGSLKGNRITALRWARILRELGHTVTLQQYAGSSCDVLIALHALRSFPAIQRFHSDHPDRPLIVVLTGTDLYHDLDTSQDARKALEWATRIIALQPLAAADLPSHLHGRLRVIYQSVPTPRRRGRPRTDIYEVCVIGHLRPVKDPFRTAMAARLLPASSRIQVLHLGAALSGDMELQARAEMASNPRYHWLGERPRRECLRLLSRCRLMVLSSNMEGGANVVSEALAASVPVLSSMIPGSVGLLGADYPGYFPVGDTQALAALLQRAETDPRFYTELKSRCAAVASLADPVRERQSWQSLLGEIAPTE